MKQIGVQVFQLMMLLFISLLFCSNAAQPGVWNAGGGGFSFLFPEDSSAFRRIQMKSEAIAIQLYPGFAVVKGTYQMLNTTDDSITIRVGYPVNGIYDSGYRMERNEITFDGLYRLKVIQDGRERPIIERPVADHQPHAQTFDNDNWYVWESVFPPAAVSEISVYFIVNTNDAKITEGYARDRHNAFIYILESGRVWQQPIGEATFKVQFMDGLEVDDLHGISNSVDFGVLPDSKLLYGKKSFFTPMPEDNLVINYGEHREALDFQAETEKSTAYFAQIDELAFMPVDETSVQPYLEADPYVVHQVSGLTWFWMFSLLGAAAILILLIFIGRFLLRRSRRF